MKLIASQELLVTPIFRVTMDHAVDPGGFEIRRAIVRHRGSAVMMARDARGRILLVRQYRLPARACLWELPAGRIDEGETPLRAARRELREETGCSARKWTRLLDFFPSPGYVEEKMTLFLAEELSQGEAQPMEDERIETGWFSLKQMEEMIASGEIRDAKTIIGWALLRCRLRQPGRRAR
ncbi:MAG: NUDIX hydrolase [Bryobacteraceae bacterium]|nr:NUDIX hydrolase [Bryobacteraceae bacterium]